MSNPTVEKAARIASEQGRIHRVIGIQPKDSYGTVGLEQLGDGEGWEMFVSEGNCVFSILSLTTDDLKTLADFFGEMARVSAKLEV